MTNSEANILENLLYSSKTADKSTTPIDELVSKPSFRTGDIIRLKIGTGTDTKFRIWKITGIHLSAVNHEDLVSLKPLEINSGSIYGVTVPENLVPLELLTSHPCIEIE